MLTRFLSQDLAIDLGSERTRVWVRGFGLRLELATAVALRPQPPGPPRIVEIGDPVYTMRGRTPNGLQTIWPVRNGRIVEDTVAEAFLDHIRAVLHGRNALVGPCMFFAVPTHAPERALRTLHHTALAAGAREVHFFPQPFAVALGTGLDLDGPFAHMIIDIGAGSTHIAVICRQVVVSCTTLEIGGDVFTAAITRKLRHDAHLLIGPATAERLKHKAISAIDPAQGMIRVSGRCLDQHIPRTVEIDKSSLSAALARPVETIGDAIRRVLEETPPTLAHDIVTHGAFMCGGASRLHRLDMALRAHTGIAILSVDEPETALIKGLGQIIEDRGRWSAIEIPVAP